MMMHKIIKKSLFGKVESTLVDPTREGSGEIL